MAIVVGVRRNDKRQKQMGARRVVRHMIELFLEESMPFLLSKVALAKTVDAE